MTSSRPPQILRNLKIRELFDECLKKTGAQPGWRTLRKHTIVNGEPLPRWKDPPESCFWELGHIVEKQGDDIIWMALTVYAGEHVFNHVARFHPDGTVEGEVNCFANGLCRSDDSYLIRHLNDWLERITEEEPPYWDQVDGVATKEQTTD